MNGLILGIIVGVGIFLIIIAIIIIIKSKQNQKVISKTKPNIIEEEHLEFEDLMDIVKSPNSDSKRVLEALELFNKHFSIDEKNEQKYLIFFSRALTHKSVNKDIFQYFHKEIKLKNPKFKNQLDIIEKKAL